MNDTPQGDGNVSIPLISPVIPQVLIRMNDTPQGDGNTPIE